MRAEATPRRVELHGAEQSERQTEQAVGTVTDRSSDGSRGRGVSRNKEEQQEKHEQRKREIGCTDSIPKELFRPVDVRLRVAEKVREGLLFDQRKDVVVDG